MDTTTQVALARWGDFYLIAGGAAAALTGLQFVVQTLMASGMHHLRSESDAELGIAAFGTPVVVHFALALLLSAIMSAPWPGFLVMHIAVVAVGLGALVYWVIVLRRMLRQEAYEPLAYDWIWYLGFPAASYVAVIVAGLALGHGAEWALFAVGGATMLLLFVGIHNSWDTITYLTVATMPGGSTVVVESKATVAGDEASEP